MIPLSASGNKDVRFPQRLTISMSTILVTNCGSLHSQDSDSFFKSLSTSLLDFVDGVKLSFDAACFRKFLLQLNQSSFMESEQGKQLNNIFLNYF